MNVRVATTLGVAAVCAYMVGIGWAMTHTTYDTWGVFVTLPPLAIVGVLILRKMFGGDLAALAPIMYVGLAVKMIGAALRYWVGFEAYEGAIDAQRYHDYAVGAATDVWDGRADIFSIFPGGTGTPFAEGLTALLYTLTGTSKMSGFAVFAFLGFIGTAFFVKAACIAIPGLARTRYALLCVVAPSLVYWPSSIGKDALMLCFLGVATYGMAVMFSTPKFVAPLSIIAIGLLGAGYIRPHMVGIWLAGAFPALVVAVLRGRDPWGARASRAVERAILVPIIILAAIVLVIVSLATVRYLEPGQSDDPTAEDSSITAILDETSRRTIQAGSAFEPPSIASPANWPYASVRTLTRPLLYEASGAAQLIVALELTLLIGLAAVSWRRLVTVPKMLVTNPYFAFAMTTLFLAGLAFTSFANLAILARQKSIVFPFMLLLVTIPPRPRPEPSTPAHSDAHRDQVDRHWADVRRDMLQPVGSQNSSMSPNVKAQLASGGSPRSLTARQVRTGPPPGRGTNDDDVWA